MASGKIIFFSQLHIQIQESAWIFQPFATGERRKNITCIVVVRFLCPQGRKFFFLYYYAGGQKCEHEKCHCADVFLSKNQDNVFLPNWHFSILTELNKLSLFGYLYCNMVVIVVITDWSGLIHTYAVSEGPRISWESMSTQKGKKTVAQHDSKSLMVLYMCRKNPQHKIFFDTHSWNYLTTTDATEATVHVAL